MTNRLQFAKLLGKLKKKSYILTKNSANDKKKYNLPKISANDKKKYIFRIYRQMTQKNNNLQKIKITVNRKFRQMTKKNTNSRKFLQIKKKVTICQKILKMKKKYNLPKISANDKKEIQFAEKFGK